MKLIGIIDKRYSGATYVIGMRSTKLQFTHYGMFGNNYQILVNSLVTHCKQKKNRFGNYK